MAAGDQDIAIAVHGLRNAFGDQVIHEDLDLEVRKGEILGVVGGSGTGKSVLMRSIIRPPDAGSGRGHRVRRVDDRQAGGRGQGDPPPLGRAVPERRLVLDADRRREYRGAAARYYPRLSEQLLDEIAGYKIAMSGLPAEAGPKYPSGCRDAQAPASPARWRSTPICCSSTSRPPGWTRSAPPPSTNCSPTCKARWG